ncbi:uncharacterized protein [Linepithema humile]|uniref:uncharacterized protein n=1 Tax=Linepithema humile TaxID=83485 RepID=UPI00351E7DAA
MEWMIIHFLDDNVVEAIPSAWVFDDICYWPPFKGSKLTQAISSCMPPTFGEWNMCKIRQLANGKKYYNLLKAKAKCAKAEDTSDLNSDLEGKRQIKRKRFFDEKDSEDDIAQSDSNPTLQYNISLGTTQNSKSLIHFLICYEILYFILTINRMFRPIIILNSKMYLGGKYFLEQIGIKSQSISFTNESVLKSATGKHNKKENRVLPTTIIYNKCSSQTITPTDNNLFDDNFKKQVLRQLQIINLRQQQITEDLSVLLTKANSEKDELILSNKNSIFNNYNFPLKEVQELEALEEFLIHDNNFKTFIKEIMQIGGVSYKHMIKRLLTRIMSDDLSNNKTYSYIGFKRKRNFSILRTCSAIVIATQKTHDCSEAMIETVIKYWLVKSTERQKKSRKEK